MVSRGARPAILILSSAPSALAGGALAIAMGGGVLSLGSLGGLATSTVLSLFLLLPLILAFRYRERPHERAWTRAGAGAVAICRALLQQAGPASARRDEVLT